MEIYVDIEIMDGKLVYLKAGDTSQPVTYDMTPQEALAQYEEQGAAWFQIIDIDGALTGESVNTDLIQELIQQASVPVQVGGGIRTIQNACWWLDNGAERILLGTSSIVDQPLLHEICGLYPERVVVALESLGERAVIKGWREQTVFDVFSLAESFQNIGAAGLVLTDIDSSNNDIASTALTMRIADMVDIPVISSGTIKNLNDITTLNQLGNISGAIIGKALHDKSLSLEDALKIARQKVTRAPV